MTKKEKDDVVIDIRSIIQNSDNAARLTAKWHVENIFGMYLRPIVLQWILGANIIPFQTVTEIAGEPGTMKTTLTYEIMKWCLEDQAWISFIDTEHKTSASMISSFLKAHLDSIRYHNCYHTADWQNKIMGEVLQYKKAIAEVIDGTDLNVPFLLCIDSLYGSQSKQTVDKLNKEGDVSGAFAANVAKDISQFMPSLKGTLEDSWYMIVFTNHLKEVGIAGPQMPGMPKKKDTPGGFSPKFHASYRLQIRNHGDVKRYGNKIVTGKILSIRPIKNAHGPSNQDITVEVAWKRQFDEDTQGVRQDTRFMWQEALVDLVEKLIPHGDFKPLKEFTGLKKRKNKYVLESLSEDEMTKREAGALLQSSENLEKMQNMLAIERRQVYIGGRIMNQDEYFRIKSSGVPGSDEGEGVYGDEDESGEANFDFDEEEIPDIE